MAAVADDLLAAGPLTRAEQRRIAQAEGLTAECRSELGQYFTPAPIARLLADMFEPPEGRVRVLDPGAGVGSLSAALVERAASEGWHCLLDVTALEVDDRLLEGLEATLSDCCDVMPSVQGRVEHSDFLTWAAAQAAPEMFQRERLPFDLVIMNPPYGKLRTASATHERLRRLGVRTSNLYSAFVWLASRLLVPGGQLVAITPRSFCNGSYFRPFRQALLDDCVLRDIHVFESRDTAFRDGAVLQENIIFRIVRSAQRPPVQIAVSSGSGLDEPRRHEVSADSVVHPKDPRLFIRIPEDPASVVLAEHVGGLPQTLAGLGVTASTGRVVDFRSREHLREDCDGDGDAIPLIYPGHLRRGRINWPGESNSKPCAIAVTPATKGMFLPSGEYVLVKRFSSKEERRRVVAAVLESLDLPSDVVAMENHVNVLHVSNRGMERYLAWGLAAYLNSTIVDLFFRQFNGHTQVNAADLESLRYPDVQSLLALGAEARSANFEQAATDLLVERHVPALEGVR
ncbi:Eco57I restriction-modification methylase domain-containing protein [Candidatus Poriferisodalis sp.]|uniref:Eco57I restriction-modification methylase domain-containing protein n=1 Tax=Candidatus Poriferisodalis sp. TaxID=3101277 RepID=UPI003AF516D1